MAKKEKVVSDSKIMGFDELNSFLTKEVSPLGSLINVNENIGVKEWISTGNYALDLLISGRLLDGGVPDNRMTGFGGVSGSGKTFVALNIVREAQKKGYFIIYMDSENAIDETLTTKFGINSNMFRIEPMTTVEDFKIYMARFIDKMETTRDAGKKLPKVMIVLDSMGDLASKKETDDAIEGSNKADMTRAKQLKSVFRIVTSKLGQLRIPLIITNHTYLTQDMYPKEIFSGGCLNPDALVKMADGTNKQIKDIKEGDLVETLDGPYLVEKTVSFTDKELYEIELENGSKYICSSEHRFLTGDNWEIDDNWTRVDNLTDSSEIKIVH